MGSGVSTLPTLAQEYPDHVTRLHERYADIFMNFHYQFKDSTLSRNELREILLQELEENEMDILYTLIKEEIHELHHYDHDHEKRNLEEEDDQNESRVPFQHQVHPLVNILCCIDGTTSSLAAFEHVLRFQDKLQFLELFHAYQSNEEHLLPHEERSENIRKYYENRLQDIMSSSLYSFNYQERFNKSPFYVLSELLDPLTTSKNSSSRLTKKPDFIFLGYSNERTSSSTSSLQNQTTSYPTILGSAADIALRSIHSSFVICKASPPKSTHLYTRKSCAMMINFSNSCKIGLEILFKLLSPQDRLQLVYFAKPDVSRESLDRLVRYYQKQLKLYGPNSTAIHILHTPHDANIGHCIVEYCNTQKNIWTDIVHSPSHPNTSTGNDGTLCLVNEEKWEECKLHDDEMGKELDYLAIVPRDKLLVAQPLTEYILEHVKCNFILCK